MKNNQTSKVIIFDFGGVLIDWSPHYLYRQFFNDDNAVDRFLDEIGFFEWNTEQDRGRPFAEAVAEHCRRFPQYAEQIKAYDIYWEEFIGGPIQPTVDILYDLKLRGHTLYGLTNWSAEKFKLIRSLYEFFDLLDDIVISGEVKLVKPDPRIYTLLLEKIGVKPEACLFIDDSQKNIQAAEKLGFGTVLFESPEQLRIELQRLGLL